MFTKKMLKVAYFMFSNLVGTGFFMIPCTLAALGSNSVFSWLVCLSITLVYSIILGRLYELFPESEIITDFFTFNDLIKKTIAILYIFCCIIGNIGVVLMIFNETLKITFLPFIIAFILLITVLNDFLEYKHIEKTEEVTSILKFLILIAFPVVLYFFDTTVFVMPEFSGNTYSIFKIGIASFWCFLGIETSISFGKGKDAKNGLLLGVLLSAILYITLSLFILGVIPKEILSNCSMPYITLLDFYNLDYLKKYMLYLILFVLITSFYSWVATVAKTIVLYAEADLLPSIFKIKARSGFSRIGLYLSSIFMIFIIILMQYMHLQNQFLFIADLTVKFSLILYSSCALVLFKYTNYDKILCVLGVSCTLFCLFF